MTASPRLLHFTSTILVALALCTAILVAQNDVRENRPPGDGRAIRSNRNTPNETGAGKRENAVSITIEGDFRIIKSNGWPDHAPGDFPRRGNPNTASPQNSAFRVPLKPVAAAEPQRRGGWFFGVAVNGVPFEVGTAETWNNDPRSGWRYEANTGFLNLGLDEHSAHVQPNGAYHYHATPTGLVQRLGGDDGKMLLIAWAADGFPIYTANGYSDANDAKSAVRKMKSSYRLKTGERPTEVGGPGGSYDGRFTQDWESAKDSGDLDECNGHTGATPEFPEGIYHYHITAEFPFLPRMWRGKPDESFGKGGPGGGAPAGAGRRPGPPGDAGGMPPSGPGAGMPLPLVIRTLDAHGDGVLDAQEIENAPAALRKLDRNGDGKLTPDEYRDPGFPPGAPPPPR